MDEATTDLGRRLREADGETLARLLGELADDLDAEAARQALRNPFIGPREIEHLAGLPRLRASHDVRRDVALHPRAPELVALALIPTLFWHELARLGVDTRIRPRVRRAADLRILDRLPELALGEKAAIARQASPGVLAHLRLDPNPRVIAAMLENPRLTEAIVLPLASSDAASPIVLELLCKDPRFGVRYAVRQALSRNPRLPVQSALSNLVGLRKSDLAAVATDPRVPALVRQRARLLLGELR